VRKVSVVSDYFSIREERNNIRKKVRKRRSPFSLPHLSNEINDLAGAGR
jgi:ppGpp synthetase/RelA/SpoT-type nucleotidyltranferase